MYVTPAELQLALASNTRYAEAGHIALALALSALVALLARPHLTMVRA